MWRRAASSARRIAGEDRLDDLGMLALRLVDAVGRVIGGAAEQRHEVQQRAQAFLTHPWTAGTLAHSQ
jgi:hypothetical protein